MLSVAERLSAAFLALSRPIVRSLPTARFAQGVRWLEVHHVLSLGSILPSGSLVWWFCATAPSAAMLDDPLGHDSVQTQGDHRSSSNFAAM